jgi:tricorn protease
MHRPLAACAAYARSLGLGCALLLLPVPLRGDICPHAGMMRYPDVSATHIVFCYANDVWLVHRDGGVATPLASPPGEEAFPRFSPDGQMIAFVGNYDGNRDLYTMPLKGGVPRRVTHHPYAETLADWAPDGPAAAGGAGSEQRGPGRLIFYARGYQVYPRAVEMFTVLAEGGLPEKMPVPYGANGAVSPDGVWLAYTLHTADQRTWKRYRGGMATDVWLFNLKDHSSKRVTTWEGTDTLPMWAPPERDGAAATLYYLSDDGPEHRLNIWKFDMRSGAKTQVTQFRDFDVKWPSVGPGPHGSKASRGEIVFQLGPELHLLDLGSGQSRAVEVCIPGDRARIRPRNVETSNLMRRMDISATGKRAVLEARGDLWTLPAKEGSVRALTRTSGVFERSPAWSPDGKWVAYFSDETGEYELFITQSDGQGNPRQITRDRRTFYYNPVWSPDSKHIAISDKAGNLLVCDLDDDAVRQFDTDPWANQPPMSWSHDSRWLSYQKTGSNLQSSIWLYDVKRDEKHALTSGFFNDSNPTFDRKGDFLYFASTRDFSAPLYEDVGTTFVYADTSLLLALPLRKDVKSPLLPKSDEEEFDDKKKGEQDKKQDENDKKKDDQQTKPHDFPATGSHPTDSQPASSSAPATSSAPSEKKDEDKKEEEPKPVEIDLEGIEARAIALPMKRGSFGGLAVNHEGHLVFVRQPRRGSEDGSAIKIVDLASDEPEEKTIVSGPGAFAMSADGKKLLVRDGGALAIIDVKPDQKMDKKLDTGALRAEIDPQAEWKQILRDAWRVQRDFFYDPNMHGVDWSAMYERYAAMLPDCVSREDLSYVIREMISELNVGHAYYWGGDHESQPSLAVGMLGCDFERVEDGPGGNPAYRIARILGGAAWDSDARSPLQQPGIDVREGDWLLAVNGRPLDPDKDPWAAFQGLADKIVTLTIERPEGSPATDESQGQSEALAPPRPEGQADGFIAAAPEYGFVGAGSRARGPRFAVTYLADSPTERGSRAPAFSDHRATQPPLGRDARAGAPAREAQSDDQPDSQPGTRPATQSAPASQHAGPRQVVVKTIADEAALRFRDWIEHNRRHVETESAGKVGYVYVPDTGANGQNELFRQFYGQVDKEALIIDERWNGGGQIPTRFIELLNRPITNYWARRDGNDWPWPPDSHQGPKCMLINGLSGSGGDMFPWLFRHNRLGKIIGTRTWGGLVGISGNPELVDGGYTSAPTFAFYEKDGTWGVEGHGVDPDIEVIDDPARMVGRKDPQLDAAIDLMLTEIRERGYQPPRRPPYPDRSGMGIPPEDR